MTRFVRRRVLVVLVASTVFGGCSSPATEPPAPQPTSSAAAESAAFTDLETRDGARLGVSAVDLESGEQAQHRADERFAFCSTFKVYAAGALLAAVDAGRLALTDTRVVTEADLVPDSAVDWAPGSVATLAELASAAVTKSDNTAGNILIREVGGTQALTDFARAQGDVEFRLDRTEPELNTAIPGDVRDTTTPDSLAAGYRTLLEGETLGEASREQLVAWMAATETSTARFRAGVPDGWTTADKTGTGSYGVSNDAGLLLGPDGERILVVVLSTTAGDDAEAPAMNQLVADATRTVVDALT